MPAIAARSDCLNDACGHSALIDVSSYPAKTEVPIVPARVKCSNAAASAWNVELQPNWKELPAKPTKLWFEWARPRPSGLALRSVIDFDQTL
jgi:hypothetical protein